MYSDYEKALELPVIIVGGIPRSGTTYCQFLLDSHEQVRI